MRAYRARFADSAARDRDPSLPASHAITSKENRWLKRFRAALAGEPDEANAVGIEGPRLLEEALGSGVDTLAILVCPAGEKHLAPLGLAEPRAAGPPLLRTTDRLFASLAATEAPQGIAALVRLPEHSFDDLVRGVPLVPVLFGVQDPGNVGAIVRSADAFGATGIVTVPPSASPYGPKAVRASAGSVFRLPTLVRAQVPVLLAQLRVAGLKLVATTTSGGVPGVPTVSLESVDLRGPAAVLIGSEARGLPPEVLGSADLAIRIQHSPTVQSLNAAVAASVVLYEAGRQRSSSWRNRPNQS